MITSTNDHHNNDYNMHTYEKSTQAIISIFRWVSWIECLIIFTIFFTISVIFPFDGTILIPSRHPWRIFVINRFCWEYLVQINILKVVHKTQKYVFLQFYLKNNPSALKSSWCSSKVFVHGEEVQTLSSSLCKTKMNLFWWDRFRNNKE